MWWGRKASCLKAEAVTEFFIFFFFLVMTKEVSKNLDHRRFATKFCRGSSCVPRAPQVWVGMGLS